tara:strand:+ start:261 stop:548 length:288 start_codon:yes stop_codon:yes gene_type:complete
MIDTDKYEGHKTAPWRWLSSRLIVDGDNYSLPLFQLNGEPNELDTPDVHLIADAPLLLAEVKRLRAQLSRYTQFVLWVEEEHNEVFDEYEGKDEL